MLDRPNAGEISIDGPEISETLRSVENVSQLSDEDVPQYFAEAKNVLRERFKPFLLWKAELETQLYNLLNSVCNRDILLDFIFPSNEEKESFQKMLVQSNLGEIYDRWDAYVKIMLDSEKHPTAKKTVHKRGSAGDITADYYPRTLSRSSTVAPRNLSRDLDVVRLGDLCAFIGSLKTSVQYLTLGNLVALVYDADRAECNRTVAGTSAGKLMDAFANNYQNLLADTSEEKVELKKLARLFYHICDLITHLAGIKRSMMLLFSELDQTGSADRRNFPIDTIAEMIAFREGAKGKLIEIRSALAVVCSDHSALGLALPAQYHSFQEKLEGELAMTDQLPSAWLDLKNEHMIDTAYTVTHA